MRRPVTIQDLAGSLGMHKSTVSLALSGKGNISAATRARVSRAAHEMGYQPNPLAQRLALGLNNTVAPIVSGVLDLGLATEKILLVQQGLIGHALEAPIYTCSPSGAEDGQIQAAEIRQLWRQRPRAIVCSVQRLSPAAIEELARYQRDGGLLVSYDTPAPLECDQVLFDRRHNAYQAARYLLDRGHRSIGFAMSGGIGASTSAADALFGDRVEGFRTAMAESGAVIREDWLFQIPAYEEGGEALARRFLALRDRPTALCVVNDYVALAFMAELARAGVRVPEDVSVVGHDNQRIAAYCPPPLTSASQPAIEIADAVVSLLMDRLEGNVGPARIRTIRGRLVDRGSVNRLPGAGPL